MPIRKPGRRPFTAHRPFLRCEALAAGITDAELAGPQFRQLLWGVHVDSDVLPTLRVRGRAALLIAPGQALLTHHTAATLWGATVPDTPNIHVGIQADNRLRAEGISTHRYADLPPAVPRHGLRVTSPEQTFLDLAAGLPLVDLVVLGDTLVKAKATTPEKLVAAADAVRSRGAKRARRAAALVRTGVDSPMETRVRLLMVLAGLPEPIVNYEVRNEHDRVVYRIDLSFPDLKLAIEYDGRHHIEREKQWSQDLCRREDLEGDGWRFVVLISPDVFATPEHTLNRIVNVLAERGRVVRVRRDEWRRYFPGRQAALA